MAEGCSKDSVNSDVKRFTVLLGGAFEGIEKTIKERLTPQNRIEFGKEEEKKLSKAEQFRQVTKADLVSYGMLPELIRRIGTILSWRYNESWNIWKYFMVEYTFNS